MYSIFKKETVSVHSTSASVHSQILFFRFFLSQWPQNRFLNWRKDGKKGSRFICLFDEPLLNGLRNHFSNTYYNKYNSEGKISDSDQKVFNAMHRVHIMAPSITVILMRVWLWYCHWRKVAATAAPADTKSETTISHPMQWRSLLYSRFFRKIIFTATISIFN